MCLVVEETAVGRAQGDDGDEVFVQRTRTMSYEQMNKRRKWVIRMNEGVRHRLTGCGFAQEQRHDVVLVLLSSFTASE